MKRSTFNWIVYEHNKWKDFSKTDKFDLITTDLSSDGNLLSAPFLYAVKFDILHFWYEININALYLLKLFLFTDK